MCPECPGLSRAVGGHHETRHPVQQTVLDRVCAPGSCSGVAGPGPPAERWAMVETILCLLANLRQTQARVGRNHPPPFSDS
jgi:hypothetical protein